MSLLAPRVASDITLPFANEGRWKVAVSDQDESVNFIRNFGPGQMLEARYVRRRRDYVAAYLSSHLGCAMACRFCHLTQTGQTDMTPVGSEGFLEQAGVILRHYQRQIPRAGKADRVNFNFMARGEPLANGIVTTRPGPLSESLLAIAGRAGLRANLNISTIMPEEAEDLDLRVFAGLPITLYYSLYSLDKAFRKRWLPKAMDPLAALDKLAEYQQKGGQEVVFHWALIKGQNDKAENAHKISKEIAKRGIAGRFNLVEYNPFSKRQGEQAGKLAHTTTLRIMGKALGAENARQVVRIGYDVKASCGMFMTGDELANALQKS